MTSWQPQLAPGEEPVYLALVRALERDVESGRLAPGARLPTQRALASALGVHLSTVTRALNEAARRGLVEGEVGRGTFVRRSAPRPALREPAPLGARSEVDLGFNLPVGGPGPRELARALEELARGGLAPELLHGYHFAGLPAHREAGARWIARAGFEADAQRTLVTGGAQHAMAMAFAVLARPGETILCEAATYPGAKALAELFGFELQGVAMDGDGLLPDALESACRRTSARVLYTMPTLHNPMGVVLSRERRERIAEIARERELSIVEDDTYGFLCEAAPPPFARLVPERTYFVTSLSKCLASGLRIGYLHAPAGATSVLERLIAAGAAVAWMASPLMAELAARWLADGTVERAVEEKRGESRARQTIARAALQGIEGSADPASCHVWLALPAPWRGEEFAARALQRGVSVTGPGAFVVARNAGLEGVRLCLGTPPDRADLERGLAILAGVLAGKAESWSAIV